VSSNDQNDSTSKASVPRDLGTLIGSCVVATDGKVGMVRNLLFDDHSWTVCYLVIDAGKWTKGRDLVLALAVAGRLRWVDRSLGVQCTREQVLNSPEAIPGSWDELRPPDTTRDGRSILERWLHSEPYEEPTKLHGPEYAVRTMLSPRLRSTRELLDYRVWAGDREIGRLHGFLVDDNSWHLKYSVVKTGDGTHRRTVRVPTCAIEFISEKDRRINLSYKWDGI
jgi:hypothetical protein